MIITDVAVIGITKIFPFGANTVADHFCAPTRPFKEVVSTEFASGSMPNAGGDVSSSSPRMFHGGVAVGGANTASNGGMVDSDAIIVFLDTDRVTTCPRQNSLTSFQKHESTTSSEQRPQTSPQQDEQPQPQQSNAQVSKSSTPMSSSKGNKGKFNSNSNGIFSPVSAGSVEQRNTTSSSQSSGTLEYTHEEKIPQHLREHLIQSLSLLRDSLRKPTRNLPFYGYCAVCLYVI